MSFQEDEIIFLIGAGCSVEANIPNSWSMIEKLENHLKMEDIDGESSEDYRDLYYFLKSSIIYLDGLEGKSYQYYNIEKLVNTINVLLEREKSPIYPFIGSWSPELMNFLAKDEFNKNIRQLRNFILQLLNNWVTLERDREVNYYCGFFDFQSDYQFPLRIFSLNYDLCFEKCYNLNYNEGRATLETGFDEETRIWNGTRFEKGFSEQFEVTIYLYKLHGSIDWERDHENGLVKKPDNIPIKPDLIFGTDIKMQYTDPYLFYTHEFRKYTLNAKIIIIVGYGFNDDHINGILQQALKAGEAFDDQKLVLIISPNSEAKLDAIREKFDENIHHCFIAFRNNASEFLSDLSTEKIKTILREKGLNEFISEIPEDSNFTDEIS